MHATSGTCAYRMYVAIITKMYMVPFLSTLVLSMFPSLPLPKSLLVFSQFSFSIFLTHP